MMLLFHTIALVKIADIDVKVSDILTNDTEKTLFKNKRISCKIFSLFKAIKLFHFGKKHRNMECIKRLVTALKSRTNS